MELRDLNENDSELEKYLELYAEILQDESLSIEQADHIEPPFSGVVFVTQEDSIVGVAEYFFIDTPSAELDTELTSRLDPTLSDVSPAPFTHTSDLQQYRGEKPLLWLLQMEAFQKRRGIGRLIVDHLKAKEIEGIVLVSAGSSLEFYEKQGFAPTGYFSDVFPILTWMK